MITAIIFDCFGVLTTDGWLPFKQRHFGHDPNLLEAANSISKQSDSGLISYAVFLESIAELARIPLRQAREEIESNVANDPLFEFIKQLKPQYKIGFLSNASANMLTTLFSQQQIELFEVVAVSFETGFVKPDERAYYDIAERLGVPPEECVLVDDVERNCTAAIETGMKAIWHKDTDQTVGDLKKLLERRE